MSDAAAHLGLLLRLLDAARPGAHFPDVRRVREWLHLLAKPFEGRTVPKLELHPVSGFPTERSLSRLLERQRIAKEFFAAHKTRPPRSSDQFNVALAACELWSPGTHANVMSADSGRFVVVHDRFDDAGLVRFTVQLEQQRAAKHVSFRNEAQVTCPPAFIRAVEQACDGDATTAGVRLVSLGGLTVHEVVRGELGPFASKHAGAFTPMQPGDGEALLSTALERVGSGVANDHLADAWPPADPHAETRRKLGWRRARDRKLACTAGIKAGLQELTKTARMMVRAG